MAFKGVGIFKEGGRRRKILEIAIRNKEKTPHLWAHWCEEGRGRHRHHRGVAARKLSFGDQGGFC